MNLFKAREPGFPKIVLIHWLYLEVLTKVQEDKLTFYLDRSNGVSKI